MALKAQVFIYAHKFDGEPKLSDFMLVEEDIANIVDGEFLAEAIFISVDPYQRTLIVQFSVGTVMVGRQVARVIESKNEIYPIGTIIFGNFGWRSHTVVDPSKFKSKHDLYPLPEIGDLPYSLALGALGMPGNSAFYGFLELCQPKAGETVVVTAAAGAVGSLVGQIAKLKGCKVIGFAGSDAKCKFLEDELGFDNANNYKKENVEQLLKKAAPNGIDCYFDNVGGELSQLIIDQMNQFGRISICGAISTYNDQPVMISAFRTFHRRQLKMEGFLNYRWIEKWMNEGMFVVLDWLKTGNLKYHETITEGFAKTSIAFINMMNGKNIGKAIVRV